MKKKKKRKRSSARRASDDSDTESETDSRVLLVYVSTANHSLKGFLLSDMEVWLNFKGPDILQAESNELVGLHFELNQE